MSYQAITDCAYGAQAHSYFIRVVLLSPVVSDTGQATRTRLLNTVVNARHGSFQSVESCDGLYHHRRGSVQALCIHTLAWQLFFNNVVLVGCVKDVSKSSVPSRMS